MTASCPSTGRVRWSRVPRPRLVVLDGEDHMAQAGDVHAWLDHVEVFVTGMVSSASPPTQRVRPAMRTMGGFRVRVGDDEVPMASWGSRRARQLCKRLAVAAGQPVPREQLMDLLWRSEEHTSELQSLMRISYAVFCLK